MPWDITSVVVEGNLTTIGAVDRDRERKRILLARLTKMTMPELLESQMCLKENHHRFYHDLPCSEGHSISVFNYESCYAIDVSCFDVDETAERYKFASDRKLSDSYIKLLKEEAEQTAANFAAWSSAPFVKAEDSAAKNSVCDKMYLGLPWPVHAHVFGQISMQ